MFALNLLEAGKQKDSPKNLGGITVEPPERASIRRFLLLSKEASARALDQSPILRLNTASAPEPSPASLVSRDENIARTNLFSRSLLP